MGNSHESEGHRIFEMVARAIIGKQNVIIRALLAILARGHILIEDIPGVGKTTLALAFSKALSLDYNRMQFTPDVLPSDVTGFTVFNRETGHMDYKPGTVMCNLFLADELNRATSRTQSALLEAMEEGQVTVDGVPHRIPQPFIVIATQNPVGAAGTQLLPDSQLDRFMVRLSLGYPEHDDEVKLIKQKQGTNLLDRVEQVIKRSDLEVMRREVDTVYIDPSLLNYIVALVGETRRHRLVLQGASPRASIATMGMAKALAYIQGRDFVLPKDIAQIFIDTVAHRLIPHPEALSDGGSVDEILSGILNSVRAPHINKR